MNAQLPFSTSTVLDPSQGVVPPMVDRSSSQEVVLPTVVRSSHLNYPNQDDPLQACPETLEIPDLVRLAVTTNNYSHLRKESAVMVLTFANLSHKTYTSFVTYEIVCILITFSKCRKII